MESQDLILRKLLAEIPELLADYFHLAADADGNVDAERRKRHAKISKLYQRYTMYQVTK